MDASANAPAELEAVIQARGRELLERVRPERLIVLSPAWWQERLMAWASSDPEFRVKLLRFVDVLPTLRTPAAVADHVRQYFRDESPLPVRAGAAVAGSRTFRPVLSRVVRQGVFTMADRFIGGATVAGTLPGLRALLDAGSGYTVDLLGEAVLSEAEADGYAARYHALVEALAGQATPSDVRDALRRPNVSLKLSALTSHFEPAAPAATAKVVLARLLPLLEKARRLGVFVNVDMEQERYRELVQTIFAEAVASPRLADWDGAGIVVQAYLVDALNDLAWLRSLAGRRGTPITVRLVKGAYWDEEVVIARQERWPVPVHERKEETDASFERCAWALAASYPHLRPAFGTHNPRSIAAAIAATEAHGLPKEAVEFQMLHGMAEGLRKAVGGLGYRTRLYVPSGAILPGMAYLVRRLLENTSNESWLMHRHEEGDPEELLRAPVVAYRQPVPAQHEARGATEPRPRGSGAAHGDRLETDAAGVAFANAPAVRFHVQARRSMFEQAIERERSAAGRHWPLPPEVRGPGAREEAEVRYPADPALVVGIVEQADERDADRAVRAAQASAEAWRRVGWHGRAGTLRAAAEMMEARRDELAATMVLESAKPWREADGDVCEAIDYLRYYADAAERLSDGVSLLQPPGERNLYRYEPRGVAAVISPWNFPLAIPTGMTSAALAAGCPAILKPAEQSPTVALKLVEILHEAGVPGDVVRCLPGPGESVGRALVEHPGVDVVAFTGSNAVGLEILKAAAVVRPGQRNVKRTVLEMGGKNAVIVDDDADLDQAVAGVVASAFGYAGQKCSACSRVFVLEGAYREFKERLAAAVESLVVGPPHDPATEVPPLISMEALTRAQSYVKLGETEGRLVAKGRALAATGYYVAPHVFEAVPFESRLAREEVFGPVLTMWPVASFDDALARAMESPFGLTGGLFSRNPARIARAMDELRVGNLYINRKITGAAVGRQPFGGLRMSGAGDKAGGPEYLLQFVAPRVVTENTMRRGFAPGPGDR